MRASPSAPRFLSRLRVTGLPYEDPRVESVLAYSRVFLAFTSLIVWRFRPAGESDYRLGLLLLVGYTLHSLVLVASLQKARKANPGLVRWMQASDIVWPALLCLFTDPPNSIFFVFFLFAMIAAAFRWGFVETMATAEISAALLLAQAGLVAYGPPWLRSLLFTSIEPTRIIMRCGFLLMAGFLLGFLAETEKELRAEIALTNHYPVPGPGWWAFRERVTGANVRNWSHLREPPGVRGGGPNQHWASVQVGCCVVAAAARPNAGDLLPVVGDRQDPSRHHRCCRRPSGRRSRHVAQ